MTRITLLVFSISVLEFYNLCIFTAQAYSQPSKKSRESVTLLYLHAVELQSAPEPIGVSHRWIRYRIVVQLNEIYETIRAECIEMSAGEEPPGLTLVYSRQLDGKDFVGSSKPGEEGTHVKCSGWLSPSQARCIVGKESYIVDFDIDPERVKVTLEAGR